MISKKISRTRRARRIRAKIKELAVNRLCIHRTPKHIYAQILTPCGSQVLASASTLDKELRTDVKYSGNKDAAAQVGALIAKRASEAKLTKVAFDRSGFKFHGRIKALADAAREGGMLF
ncbi:MAG: 50S ribosomal protein L18 [Coxiella sp. (in: Bacteria)]|nr:MAG: 50S ribosomal protein L18 [Coxiella sp. (in: g-proteobacteria)]